jgi:rhomboid protease GluP
MTVKMQRTFKVETPRWSVLSILLGVMAVLFALDRMNTAWFGGNFFERHLFLSVQGLMDGNLWQLATHLLMHDGIGHILGNAIILFFFGSFIEQRYGGRRLLEIFFISGVVGALVWVGVNFRHPFVHLLGASGGCLGIFTYFCLVFENRPMDFPLFFTISLKLKPRTLLMITTVFEIYCFFMLELNGGQIANSGHIGGIFGGLLCYLFYHHRQKYVNIFREKLTSKSRADAMQGDSYKLYITSYSARRREVDRILDKINESGFKSLTEAEKNTLNSAKHLMHR